MRKVLSPVTIAIALGLVSPTVSLADICGSAPGNLVTNCGFENGDFNGWLFTGNTSFAGVSLGFFDGFLPNSGSAFAFLGPLGSDGFLSQSLATIPGRSYNISWYLGSDGGTPNDFSVQWNGVTVFLQTDIPSTSGAMNLHTVTEKALGGDTVTFGFRNDSGFLALDDTSVVLSPEPGGLVLLLPALAVLARARRRHQAG
jgi:hypothetical protein